MTLTLVTRNVDPSKRTHNHVMEAIERWTRPAASTPPWDDTGVETDSAPQVVGEVWEAVPLSTTTM